jgi:hypothetical protein
MLRLQLMLLLVPIGQTSIQNGGDIFPPWLFISASVIVLVVTTLWAWEKIRRLKWFSNFKKDMSKDQS